ncbi:MAG: DMT family transporter [Salinivirgaceae bacterium]|nr:DMT family transporter [Salinivirgaceae bacterium]
MAFKKLMVYGIVTLAMFFWSMTYIWYKVVFEALPPISVMTFRLLFSSVFLFVFSYLIKKLQFPSQKDFYWLLVLSLFQPFLYFLAESYGVSMVSPTIAAVIISTIPMFTPFMAFLFYGHRISVFNVFGILVSFLGVLMVVLGRELHFEGSVTGILLLVGAVGAALGYSVIIVKLANKYSSFTIISWQNLFGACCFLPLFFIFDWNHVSIQDIDRRILLNLIYLAFFGSSLAYVFFTYAIKNIGITKASLFTNTIPVFTAAFAFFIFGETISVFKIVGIGVLLVGLFIGQSRWNFNGNTIR